MPQFNLKLIHVPLFGVVDHDDQSAWLSEFSADNSTTTINLNSHALEIIADDLELDADGLAIDAERYANGQYRQNARGMGGSQLGTLGEALTYLLNRSSNQDIVRVVGWRRGKGQITKGSLFPQPDFIVREGTTLSALEVKTTEAFDFIDLRDMTKKWTHLRPCSSVAHCRLQALPQLGFIDGSLTPQQHELKTKNGTIVPFPVGNGIATAVIAVDGRVNVLRNRPEFRTPPNCRSVQRKCWHCLPHDCHFALVTMRNSPGVLSLGGSTGGYSGTWLHSYERWAQALLARDLPAVRESLGALTASVFQWLESDRPNSELLRNYWGSYLCDSVRSRGLSVEISPDLGDLTRQENRFDWKPAEPTEPIIREANTEEIERLIRRRQQTSVFGVSTRLVLDDKNSESITVSGDHDYVDFRLLSSTWWMDQEVHSTRHASAIARRLLSFAIQRSGLPLLPDELVVSLQRVVVRIGESEILLGWQSTSAPVETWPRAYLYLHFDYFQSWPILLAFGDPRVRLRVMPDGRANLRVPKGLITPQ